MIGITDDIADAQTSIAKAGAATGMSKLLGLDVKNPANLKGALRSAKFAEGFGRASVTFATASATLSVVLALKGQLGLSEGTVTALEAVNATIGAVMAGLQLAQEITKAVQVAQTAMDGVGTALAFKNTMSVAGAVAALVVAALILVVALVMFFIMKNADAVGARTALAQGVATAMVVLLLFVLSVLFPIGTAIALIIGLLDGIFSAICKIANWAGGKDDNGKTFEDRNGWFCKGIVGNVVGAVAGVFYKSVPMVDMSYKDRLQFGQTDAKLIPVDGLMGMNAGNRMQVTQPVTMTVRLPDEHLLNAVLSLSTYQVELRPGTIGIDLTGAMPTTEYDRLIKEKNGFNYELIITTTAKIDSQLADLKTPANWKIVGEPDNRNRLYKIESPTTQITLSAGINWNPDLFVREYHRYSLAECGIFVGGCDHTFDKFNKFKADTQVITIGTSLIYDVFPLNLTEFYTLEQVQESGQFVNKYRLAWGGDKLKFPTLLDADGDGLRGDLDPDDKTADTDNDGLPDAFEVQDFQLNPRSADSDGDGLSDYQEMRRGTRPDRADSDGDGLSDNDEITGWELVYADAANVTKRTWVTSDPLVFDTDGDGISDQQERVLGTHPRARNTNLSVLSIRTSTNQTGSAYLAPSQTIAFTSTVRNDLRKPVAYGLLEAEVLSSTQVINPITFELQPQQGKDLTGSIAAPAQSVAGSDQIVLRNRAGANMVDPSASYADQLQGLAQPNGLKFQLNFEQRPGDESNFKDVTGNATLTCPSGYCPSVIRGTDSYGTFQAGNWYAAIGSSLSFSQSRFSLGGWVTLEKPFGGKYDERMIIGPDNVAGAVGSKGEQYLQLSVVNLQSDTPKVKIHFTAISPEGAVCEQVLTALTVPFGQKTHVFVTYDGTLVHGYKNGQLVGSYNLQNCANKVPAGNRFTIGRGASSATLYVHNVYYRTLDEGDSWYSSAEPYLQLNGSKDPFASTGGIKNERTWNVGQELTLRDASTGDANSTVYLCEEDNGKKEGRCVSDSIVDSDDLLGTVTIDPRRNSSFNTGWSNPFPVPFGSSGNLNYNIQNNFFQGALDDLRIYEATLTPQEVGQLINGSGLTFQLDEASGRTQFRNAGVDATQLTCQNSANCPTSGVKGYSGQAVNFTGSPDQTLAVDKLRARFGSNFVVSFWFKPETGSPSAVPTPLLRFGQGSEGYTLFATNSDTKTTLRARFNASQIDPIGGNGGNSYNLRCNGDEALVGIFGRAGGGIDQVGPVCVTTNSSYQWLGSPTRRGSAGGNGGGDFERICQRGSFVSGFGGRSGGLVDQIQIACAGPLDFVSAIDSRNSSNLDTVGGSGGDSQSQRVCPSNLPAVGIYGRAGGLVDSFGLTCQEQVSTQSDVFFMPANQWSHVALAENDDSLLLYVNGQPVQNIWFGPSSQAKYRLTGAYAPDLLVGGSVKGLMDEVQIQGLSVNAAKTESIGGNGGGSFDLSCQVNEALVGLFGRSGGAVDQIGPVCAQIDQNGQRVGNTVRRGSAGGNGGGDFERICAANSAMVGFQGRAGGAVDQLRPVCAPLTTNGAINTTAPTTELNAFGGNGGSEQGLKACALGVPATGIFGRAGGAVDAFGLQCSSLLHESLRKPFSDSAQVYLALDEVAGITTFVNSTGKGNLTCGAGVTCPQGGLKGQVRESLQFNNQPGMATSATPRLTVPNQPDAPFSFSTWVKLTAAPAAPATLVALHANEGTDTPAWRFQLINSGGQVVPQLVGSLSSGGSCSGSFTVTPSNVNMALNQWHQLGINYDPRNGKNDVSIYLNGRLIHQERVSGLLCRTGTTLRFGQSYRG